MKRHRDGKLLNQAQGAHMIYTEARDLDDAIDVLLQRKRHKTRRRGWRKLKDEVAPLDAELGRTPRKKVTLPKIDLREPKW